MAGPRGRRRREGKIGLPLLAGGLALLAGCGSGAAGPGTVGGTGGDRGPGAAGGPGGDGAAGAGSTSAVRPAPSFPVFDDTRLHEVSLAMAPQDWQSILDDSRGDEQRHATLTYDGVVVADVGVRPSGESSRFAGNPKMSVRIAFDAFSGGAFGGLEELKMKGQWDDGSMMRDRLSYFVYRRAVLAPREAHARLVVNGDLRGVYAVVQSWDADSIKEHFAQPVGPLYRIRGQGADPYAYLGADPAAYVPIPWERHIQNAARGDDVVASFLGALATTPARIGDVADVDTLLGYLAAFTLIMSTDGMTGDSGIEDHYQYFDPQSGRFFTLPWDPDNTFGSHGEPPTRTIYTHFSRSAPALIVRDSADLRPRYKARILALIAAVPLAAVQAEADRIYQQIKDAAHEDPVKRFPNDTFDWNVTYIKAFAAQRYAFVQDQVANGP